MTFKKMISISILLILLITNSFVFADMDEEYEVLEYGFIPQTILEVVSRNTEDPEILSRSAVILDRTSNAIIWGKNEHQQVPMASTTKILTAIVLIEEGDLSQTITVDKKAASIGGSRLGLRTNDKITMYDLLYGLMLKSGNDAALQIAISMAGDSESFAIMMNEKAAEIGLTNSNFVCPHGLDDPNHFTTPYELALLTNYALNNDKFRSVVSTKTYTVTINGYPKTINNSNELLRIFKWCIWC